MIKNIALKLTCLIVILTSCLPDKSSPNLKTKIPNSSSGFAVTYRYVQDPGIKALRNWGQNYWELKINNDESILSYTDSRGLYNFHLSVTIYRSLDNKLEITHNSLLSESYLTPTEISNLKKGDLLLQASITDNKFTIDSDFIKIKEPNIILSSNFKIF